MPPNRQQQKRAKLKEFIISNGGEPYHINKAKSQLSQMRLAAAMYRVWPGAEEQTSNPAECFQYGISVPASVTAGSRMAEVTSEKYGFSEKIPIAVSYARTGPAVAPNSAQESKLKSPIICIFQTRLGT